MELVDDHDVEPVARDAIDAVGGQRLNRCEDMAPLLRSLAFVIELTEVRVTKDLAVGPERLVQDLFAVSNKQKRWSRRLSGGEPLVVEGCHNRLPSSRC